MTADEQTTEVARHADNCLAETSSSAAPCSCGYERAARIDERDRWQDGLEVVQMTQAELDGLLEYSTTLPTGKTVGKRWKRQLLEPVDTCVESGKPCALRCHDPSDTSTLPCALEPATVLGLDQ